jgi:hypothetical protein
MKPHPHLLLLALPLAISTARAETGGFAPTVDMSGYGTAAYTRANTDQAEFGRFNQLGGAKKSPVDGVDSNLGIQGTLTVNDWLSFTGQGLARKLATDRWGADLYWAYAKAQVNKQWSLYAGRVVAPVYMISDYRNVGFANTMIRPPQEMYSQVPFDSIDGASASYRSMLGATNLTVQFAIGNAREKLALQGTAPGSHQTIRAHAFKALNVLAEHGPVTFRLGYAQTDITLDGDPALGALTGALNGAGAGYALPQLNRLADALAVNRKKASFMSVGLALDLDDILVQSEAGKRRTQSAVPDSTSWYVLGGYRFGKFMPYVSYASLKSSNSVSNTVPAACPAGYPDACTPTLQALSAAVSGGLASGLVEQSTTSIGLRWNFSQSAAFKMQFDRVRPRHGSGLLLNATPGFNRDVTVCAAGVDFVF